MKALTRRPGLLHRGVRKLLPERIVHRDVQGVRLKLPWHHRLPDYAASFPLYGQNLVRLCELLDLPGDDMLHVLDVGANVGDSARQVTARTRARVLCVEGDPYWLPFLRSNVEDHPKIEIEPSLVVADPAALAQPVRPVRGSGTTRFTAAETHEGLDRISTEQLRLRHPGFERIDVVKTDTDGYDVDLAPALARTWHTSTPVVFLEYDPYLTTQASATPPSHVWSELADLGYTYAVAWDNVGRFLCRAPLAELARLSLRLEDGPGDSTRTYWDVAVVHGDDGPGLKALEQLEREATPA